MRPLISVIIPVYMVQAYLDRCVQSILVQSYDNLEIILVDDGTKDSCAIMCDKYLLLDNRIRVVHKQNGGLSDARNIGINLSSGEYIVFVDSDDYIKKDMVEILIQLITTYHVKLAAVDIQLVNESGKIIDGDIDSPLRNGTMTFDEYIKIIHQPNGWRLVVAWNKIYHKDLFDKIRFPKGKKCEDEYIAAQVAWSADGIACTEQKEYYYSQDRGGGIINTLDFKERYEIQLDIYIKRYDFFDSIDSTYGKEYALDAYLGSLLNLLVLPGKRSKNTRKYIRFYKKHAGKDLKNLIKVYCTAAFKSRI